MHVDGSKWRRQMVSRPFISSTDLMNDYYVGTATTTKARTCWLSRDVVLQLEALGSSLCVGNHEPH